MEDPTLFDRRAAAYERSRPPYPPAVFERLDELGLVGPGRRVLDIGAGSGQATEQLVRGGCDVTAIEPGHALADRIAARWPQVALVRSRFEDASLPPASFDAAVCATALHWLDLDVALPRLHRALVVGGRFGVWWTVFGDPGVDTPFRQVVAEITGRRVTDDRTHPPALDTAYWTDAVCGDGWFDLLETRQLRWATELTSAQVRDLFGTFTGWSDAEVDEASHAVDRLGGVVTEHYVTPLYVLRATGPS